MNAQQQNFEKLFRTELESVKFELTTNEFNSLKGVWKSILYKCSLLDLDIDVKTHNEIFDKLINCSDVDFNLFSISHLLNTLTKKSPYDLDLRIEEYVEAVKVTQELTTRWNEIVLPIRDKLLNKLQTQAALQIPNNGKNVIPGRR
jgi:hypothetical protein